MNFDTEKHLILKHVAGSQAYGTASEDSDTDYRGILIPPKSFFLGLDSFEQYETKDPDVVFYDIRKFTRLALQTNPNILETLFVDDYLLVTSYGRKLLDIRNEFLTKACVRTYLGYAKQQLYRLNINPAPASRSDKRMALVEKFGYDTKYAMHLIRLLRTGIEVITEGVLRVKRPDADFLLSIRNGAYTKEAIMAMADELTEQLRQAEQSSPLPEKADYHKVNKIVTEIVEEFLEKNKC